MRAAWGEALGSRLQGTAGGVGWLGALLEGAWTCLQTEARR